MRGAFRRSSGCRDRSLLIHLESRSLDRSCLRYAGEDDFTSSRYLVGRSPERPLGLDEVSALRPDLIADVVDLVRRLVAPNMSICRALMRRHVHVRQLTDFIYTDALSADSPCAEGRRCNDVAPVRDFLHRAPQVLPSNPNLTSCS